MRAEQLICRATTKTRFPGRAASTGQRRRECGGGRRDFFAALILIIFINYESNWGESNAQACECGSAKGKAGSADAWNGCSQHDLHGGGGIGAAGGCGAG